jgi:hypothetical protein
MNMRKAVVWCAIILIGSSVADLAFTRIVGTNQNLGVQLARMFFTCVLAFFLAQGKSWARWLNVVLLTIGSAIGVISFVTMFEEYFAISPLRMLWLLGNGLVFGALAIFLTFSPRVARECRVSVE